VDSKLIHGDLTVGVNRHLDPNSEAGVGCSALTYEPGIVVENKRHRFGRHDVRDVKQAVIPLIASSGRLADSSTLGVNVEFEEFFPARPHEGLNHRPKRGRISQAWGASLGPIYARRFTKAELEQLLTFYRSPVGRRILAEQGSIAQEGQ